MVISVDARQSPIFVNARFTYPNIPLTFLLIWLYVLVVNTSKPPWSMAASIPQKFVADEVPHSITSYDGQKLYLLQNRPIMDAASSPHCRSRGIRKERETGTVSMADFHMVHSEDFRVPPKSKTTKRTPTIPAVGSMDDWVMLDK